MNQLSEAAGTEPKLEKIVPMDLIRDRRWGDFHHLVSELANEMPEEMCHTHKIVLKLVPVPKAEAEGNI